MSKIPADVGMVIATLVNYGYKGPNSYTVGCLNQIIYNHTDNLTITLIHNPCSVYTDEPNIHIIFTSDALLIASAYCYNMETVYEYLDNYLFDDIVVKHAL